MSERNIKQCGDCLHYSAFPRFVTEMVLDFAEGECKRLDSKTFSYNNYAALCPLYEHRPTKVRPRRLCDFCERKKPLKDDYGEHKLQLHRLIPLPAINLTTGEQEATSRPPFYSMFLYNTEDEENGGEITNFPVKFCPVCGRKLEAQNEKK